MAIGAPRNDGANGADSGHVRVYAYDSAADAWSQRGEDIDGEASGDDFGFFVSLSLDGKRLAVGAPFNEGADSATSLSGHVRVFEYMSETSSWLQLGADIFGDNVAELFFGLSAALSGDGTRVVVGSRSAAWAAPGKVRVYEYSESTSAWAQLGGDIDGQHDSDRFGFDYDGGRSVSIDADGSHIAIGASFHEDTSESYIHAGQVRVYKFHVGNSEWEQLGNSITGQGENYFLGKDVSLSADGMRLAVGVYGYDGGSNPADSDYDIGGQVMVLEYSSLDSSWVLLGSVINGVPDLMGDKTGHSVALSSDGTVVAIGAPARHAYGEGALRIYEYSGSSWTQVGLEIDGENTDYFGEWLGSAIALARDGETVVSSVRIDDQGSDAVRAYKRDASSPSP